METNLLTVREASQLLRVTPRFVYDRLADGELRAYKLGRGAKAHYRIEQAELQRFLSGSTAGVERR